MSADRRRAGAEEARGRGAVAEQRASEPAPADLGKQSWMARAADASLLIDKNGPQDPEDPNFYALLGGNTWTHPGRYHKTCPNQSGPNDDRVEYCPTTRYSGWAFNVGPQSGTLLEDVKKMGPGSVLQPGRWVRTVQTPPE